MCYDVYNVGGRSDPPYKKTVTTLVYRGDNSRERYLSNKKFPQEKRKSMSSALEKNSQNIFTPTRFAGYYATRSGEIYREGNKFSDGPNPPPYVLVGTHLRGGARAAKNGRCYPSVNISLRDSNGKTLKQIRCYVHRLIAETFIDNPNSYSEVDHINQDKTDNRVENLRWVTKKDNSKNRDNKRDSKGRYTK